MFVLLIFIRAFFKLWWDTLNAEEQDNVRLLVNGTRLSFAIGKIYRTRKIKMDIDLKTVLFRFIFVLFIFILFIYTIFRWVGYA